MNIVQVAESQLGQREEPKGSNKGPMVDEYLQSVGINFPAAWCMAFVYWCAEKACKENNVPNRLLKTGGVLRQWNERPKLRVKVPQPGDIFIMEFKGGTGHTGIVTAVTGDRIQTIEGNSNSTGSREGIEVCRNPKGRLISSIKGYIRI